jgi:hypothetical protein
VVGGEDAADAGDGAWLVDSPSRAASALCLVSFLNKEKLWYVLELLT